VSPTDPLSTESLNTEPIRTRRLVLRQWRDSDREPFAELNADPAVMAHFPAPMSRAESDAFVDRISEHFAARGFGLWAVETTEAGSFIGFVGLTVPRFDAHFTPAVEVGWRLARSAWGHGYATEAANAAVVYGFQRLSLDEIVSFTSVHNIASQAVMRRIGMTHDPADDFEHPNLPEGHRLRRHVLWRLRADGYRTGSRDGH
jgi:RimJ/RimL family protein N-acetyltransferase